MPRGTAGYGLVCSREHLPQWLLTQGDQSRLVPSGCLRRAPTLLMHRLGQRQGRSFPVCTHTRLESSLRATPVRGVPWKQLCLSWPLLCRA